LRPDRAEIERIGAAPAELEGVLGGRIDGTADAVAGAEREGVAAAGEFDRRAAGAAMTPPSKMLTEWALLIKMPAEPETTPELEMPPVKVGPAMSIAVLLERTSLARSIRMPWLVALMLPLSRIAPLMVLANRAMPVLAVMEPELTILPTTLATPNALVVDLPNSMPICPALIEPLLLRPPRKVPTPRTTMPSPCAKGSPFATITLALMMAPAMVSAWTTMPSPPISCRY
jgi:hypothetical protein